MFHHTVPCYILFHLGKDMSNEQRTKSFSQRAADMELDETFSVKQFR